MNATEGGNEDNNWAAELHHNNDDLFRQPDGDGTHLGECPICFLPMPLDPKKWSFLPCCSSNICKGCIYANYISNKHDMAKAWSCPFCRTTASGEAATTKRMMKRIKANDPAAMCVMGTRRYHEGDYHTAFEYLTKAAELGDPEAHYQLGVMYGKGFGVAKDKEKAVYHWEKAAIGGHPDARHNLAVTEKANGNIKRAVKHYIIAAKLGFEASMKGLWEAFKDGQITKENLEATLRAHKAAIDETKSSQRGAGEMALKGLGQKGFKI
jgi:tetratricopeptide (TPR) repeat protein